MESTRPNGLNSSLSPPKADFNGTGKNIPARANILIHEMDEYFEAAEVTNKVKMKYIFSRALSGVAKKWYDQHIRLNKDYGDREYEEIKKAFLEHYAPDNAFQKESSKDKFFKIMQTHGVTAYADALVAITVEIPSYATNSELVIDKFISGLNPKVRHHMHAVPKDSPFEAEKFLKSDPTYMAELSIMRSNKRRKFGYGNGNGFRNNGYQQGYNNRNFNNKGYNHRTFNSSNDADYAGSRNGYGRGFRRGRGHDRRGHDGSRKGQGYSNKYHQNNQRNYPSFGTNQQQYSQGNLQSMEIQESTANDSEDVDMEQMNNNLNAESQ